VQKTFDDAVLEIDNIPGILDYRYQDGSSIWLSVRFDLRMINFANSSGSKDEGKKDKITKLSIIKYILLSFFNSPNINKSSVDILSIANFEGNVDVPNAWTVFLKGLTSMKIRELLYSPNFISFLKIKNTYSLDYFYSLARIKIKLGGYFNRNKSHVNFEKINHFMALLKSHLSDYIGEKDFINIQNQVLYIDRLSPVYYSYIYGYIKAVKPKLIVCSEGNNGDWKYAALFRAAKTQSIKTAEVQHGALGLGMRYAELLTKNSVFREHKSDYLLTFGEYHNHSSNAAGKNIAIGNYRLQNIARKLQENIDQKNEDVLTLLFISEGIPATSINNGLIKTVVKGLKASTIKYQLIIRLHPTETSREKYQELVALNSDVSFSAGNYGDIYPLLKSADIIIGHTSTVLFEAGYFGKKPFIYKDEVSERYMPENLGKWFSDSTMLASEIAGFKANEPDNTLTRYFWEKGDYMDNFMAFYSTEINNQGKGVAV
jgi:hypothetical protein